MCCGCVRFPLPCMSQYSCVCRSASAKLVDDTSATMVASNLVVDASAASELATTTAPVKHAANVVTATTLSIEYPQFCRSAKERECWVLFQKMLQKGERRAMAAATATCVPYDGGIYLYCAGVTVSYDTILRGLLTPTELRAVLKQRDADEVAQQRSQQPELAADGESSAKSVVHCT